MFILYTFRWFDKPFSLIVTKGGHSSINFEHAWGDGVAVLRLFNEMYKDSKTGMTTATSQPTLDGVAKLQFDLSPSLKSAVEAAKKEVEGNTNRLSIDTMQYMKYGRNALKRFKLSPDAIMQLAIQVRFILCLILHPTLKGLYCEDTCTLGRGPCPHHSHLSVCMYL